MSMHSFIHSFILQTLTHPLHTGSGVYVGSRAEVERGVHRGGGGCYRGEQRHAARRCERAGKDEVGRPQRE